MWLARLFAASILLLATIPCAATVVVDESTLTADDAVQNAFFGASAAVDGQRVIVGSPPVAAAYIFIRSGTHWEQEQKLEPTGASGSVGFSVSIHAETAVLGAPEESVNGIPNAGAAYVFFRNGSTWEEQGRLLPENGPLADARFGMSVSVHGDTVVVGAPGQGDAGVAHVYVREDSVWSPQQELTSDNLTTDARFGGAVAVEGDTALVGAQKDGGEIGSVSVFERNGTFWELRPPGLVPDSPSRNFGNSVAMSEGTAVVGALLENQQNANRSGAAFVFVRAGTTWGQRQKLPPPQPTTDGRFGISVDVSGDTLLVGDVIVNPITLIVEEVHGHVFTRVNEVWTERGELNAGFGASLATVGDFVGLDGCTAIVGTETDPHSVGVAAGSASAYVLDTCPCGIPPDDLVAWWTLNEPGGSISHDTVSSHDGTHVNQPFPADGLIKGALEFDGHGRFVQVPDDSALNFGDSDSFTLDAWIRPTQTQEAASILEKRDSQGRGYGLKLVDKRLAFFLGDGTDSAPSYLSTQGIPPDAWSFIAVTVNRVDDKGIVYVNGVADGSFTLSDTAAGSTDNTEPLLIAAGLEKDFFFGLIDEVEIFGRPLKAAEVGFLYNALSGGKCVPCVELVDPPVAWWPLDEIEGSVAADIAGTSEGIHLNGPTFALGKVDGALEFDGQTQQVQVDQGTSNGALDFDANQSFTIDAWINPLSFQERTMTIVAKQDPQTGVGYRLFLRSGHLVFTINDGSTASPAYSSSDPLWNPSFPPGWTFVAVTVDRPNNSGTVYVDDHQPETFNPNSTAPGSLVNTGNLSIGGSQGGDFFHGRIDEVEIFDRSLNQVVVKSIYEADSRGKCKPLDGEDAAAGAEASWIIIIGVLIVSITLWLLWRRRAAIQR